MVHCRRTWWLHLYWARFHHHLFSSHCCPSCQHWCSHSSPSPSFWSSLFHTYTYKAHSYENALTHMQHVMSNVTKYLQVQVPLSPLQPKRSLFSFSAYLPGESPFSSNRIPSPDTPVKLVFIRKSSSVAPSIGRMASHRPLKQSCHIKQKCPDSELKKHFSHKVKVCKNEAALMLFSSIFRGRKHRIKYSFDFNVSVLYSFL